MGLRPYTSVKGARTNGPIANARMKIERANSALSGDIWRSLLMDGNAGAIILPDIMVTNPPNETKIVMVHFQA